jgi:hypothetical protein
MTHGWCAWYVPGMGPTDPHQANGPGQQPSPTARRQRPSHPPRSVRRASARWRPLSRHPPRTLAPPSSLKITPLDLSCRFCNCSNSTWRHRFAASVRVLRRDFIAPRARRYDTTLPYLALADLLFSQGALETTPIRAILVVVLKHIHLEYILWIPQEYWCKYPLAMVNR